MVLPGYHLKQFVVRKERRAWKSRGALCIVAFMTMKPAYGAILLRSSGKKGEKKRE